MPTPARMAATGSAKTLSSSSMKIWPESGLYRPDRMFMSVVLPAPFSPSMPRTLPRSAEIEMWSLARTPGNRFVMSRSSSRIGSPRRDKSRPRSATRTGGGLLDRGWFSNELAAAPEERTDLDAAVGELRLERVELALHVGRDLAVVIVERGQQNAVVGDRAGVVRAAEVAGLDVVEEVEHRNVDGLLGRGQQGRVGRRADADVLVGVDADGPVATFLRGLDRAIARRARHRMDDVHALVVERLGKLLALRGIAPRVVAAAAAHEGARLGRILEGAIPPKEGHLGALLLVVVLDARVQTVHEAGHAREGEAAKRADLAGLGPAGCQVTRQHRRLVDLVV